jgi:hypothetical protein
MDLGGKPRPAGRAGDGATGREAERSRTLYLSLSHWPLGPERDVVLPHRHVRSGALHPDPLRPDRRRRLPHFLPHLSTGARDVHQPRHEGPHGRGPAQLAGAGHPLHLRLRPAGASWVSATSAPTAWGSRSASCSSIRPAPGCHLTACCPCCSISARRLTVSSSRSRSRARPRPQGHIAARGCDGSWPEIRADLDSLTETEIVHDGRRFLVRGAPRAAASLALRAVSVALPPTLPPSPSD